MSDEERWILEEGIADSIAIYELALSALCSEDAGEKQMYLERIVERCTYGDAVAELRGILGWQENA